MFVLAKQKIVKCYIKYITQNKYVLNKTLLKNEMFIKQIIFNVVFVNYLFV